MDQFSRNVFRESPKAFAQDQRARSFAKVGIARGYDMEFEGLKRTLFYMPLMHSEYLDDQFMCEACFERYLNEGAAVEGGLEYATKHRIIVEKYGHFPHRNKVLGRHSSDEEIEFLKGPGSSF